MKKIYDLAVRTSEYTNRSGEKKGKWLNVGAVMEKDDGGKFIFLERTFNPAGIANPDNRSNIIISMFEPKAKTQDNNSQSGGDDPPYFPPVSDEDIAF
jgi:hypothetical protein